ncbi:NAD(P)-dependent oxidoreductase [Rhodobium gokarnense]|uniref:2-hydroxy-3-oxopropionate reductase n=1 Tax=Rhodobium gokarnense TaxID=364296 RepID=A0ABT3HDY8_9HYPH|nr:NAD(P)-dependent oxidoreductase [Rhodobium gokarnense]MCW2308491.1 2-hydroxy-3-oxopropionate reductase [Rhodobium gokarnense]
MTDTATSSATGVSRLLFVGAGVMGAPMIRNLKKAGVPVVAFDTRQEVLDGLAAEGIEVTADAHAAAREADVVVTMLPDTPDVKAVLMGEEGLGAAMTPGSLVIDMSTISATAVKEMAGVLAGRDIAMLDAPVSGGMKGAVAGTLSIMVGGAAEAFARGRPVLEAMGSTIRHVGEIGTGQVFKMCNQLMAASHIQAMCEAFALCRSFDGDLGLLREVLMGGAAGSWMLDNLGPQVLAGDTSAGFRIDLHLKDLRLANEAAFDKGLPLPGLAMATTLYLETRAHGEGGNGNQALFRTIDRMTNQAG